MKKKIIGGQIIYSLTDDNWNLNRDLIRHCINETKKAGAHISIYLGGYIVIGGDQKIVLTTGDAIKVSANTASSVDAVMSVLQST